ncbi:MAG: carbonic anhydrase [Acidimicrobiia bacterium]|nr:carbonic anhydrase [Acidimicrobiia bacterium]
MTPSTGPRLIVTADEALARLVEGNARYAEGRPEGRGRDEGRRKEQAARQTPFAVVLACADSRVPPEIVFDQGIGDLFVVRVAGNAAVDPTILASIEFGVGVLGCPLVLVLGHEQCGAVKAALDAARDSAPPPGRLGALTKPIEAAVQAAGEVLDAAVTENVRRQVVALAEDFQRTVVVGATYALHSGRIELVGEAGEAGEA